MYSRSETAQLKQEFWIAFGKYLSLHYNNEGQRINWVNYHTGFKHLYFRMEVNKKSASISIQLTHQDDLLRELFYDKFESLRKFLHEGLNEEWTWEKEIKDEEGRSISKISKTINGVNLYDRNTWPEIISFLKPRIIKLDEIWIDIKDVFEELR